MLAWKTLYWPHVTCFKTAQNDKQRERDTCIHLREGMMQFGRWLDNYDREKNKQLVSLLSAEPQAWLKENLRQFERSLKNLKNATWPISVALFVKKWQRIEEKHNWLEKCNFSFFSSIMILVVTFWLQAYDSITRSVRRLVGWWVGRFWAVLIYCSSSSAWLTFSSLPLPTACNFGSLFLIMKLSIVTATWYPQAKFQFLVADSRL